MSGTLRLRGATSGYSELQAPAVAADQTFILPTAGGTLLTTDSPISKLTLELGSASQPSLTFEGDTDTGLYSSGTNTLNLVTGGNNRLNIDSSGNIGIGSTDPSGDGWSAANDLVINSTGNSGMTIKSGASSFGQLVFNDAAGGLRGFVAYGHSDDYLGFGTAGAEWMRITSSGRVLIGNTSTSNSGLLCVKGNGNNSAGAGAITIQKGASVSGSNQLIGALSYGEGSANTAEIEVHSDQTWTGSARGSYMTFSNTALNTAGPVERMRIDSSGRLLLGTTTPGFAIYGDALTIARASHCGMTLRGGTTSDTEIFFADGTTGNSRFAGGIRYAHNTDHMQFMVNAAERMRIDSSGRVHMGNSAAGTAALNIYSATLGTAVLFQNPNTGTGSSQGGFVGNWGGQNMYLWNYENQPTIFGTNNTEKMRLDSSGTLVIGRTTSSNPARYVQMHNGDAATSAYIQSTNTGTGSGASNGLVMGMGDATNAYIWNYQAGAIIFGTSGQQRGMFDSSGNLLVGKSGSNFAAQGTEIRAHGEVVITRTNGEALVLRRNTNNGQIVSFRNTAGTTVGTIVTSSSSTAYNTSSDYRLKENIVDLTDAIPRLKNLPVHRFNFITDAELTVDGFLAHEAQLVVPESVTGEKDGEKMQYIDQSKLIPLLTAALQESILEIEKLKERVKNLES